MGKKFSDKISFVGGSIDFFKINKKIIVICKKILKFIKVIKICKDI